ncbi:MAG: hypothetical protein ACR2JR_12925 [Rubrobacteraceae bacterium]
MGYEIIAGLFCVAWAAIYASRRSRPAVVPARSRRVTHQGRSN